MITKHSVLMDRRDTASLDTKWFCETVESGHPSNIMISVAAWAEMGSPEVLTVTLEPGDLLNDDAP